jgi:TPR repeat protein
VKNALLAKHLKDAAEAGDPFAQFEVGFLLDSGHDGEQDFDKASEWYSKAAAQGHSTAEGNLLLQHVLGHVSLWSPDFVFRRLKELALTGDFQSENNVGLCYQFGFGTAQDYREAASWFLRAALVGLAEAQFNLAGLYYEGNGFEKDIGAAVEWYTRAAQQREELALLQLASLYQKGIGVAKDLSRAVTLYSTAYRSGSVRAATHLAFLFKKGLGVERNDRLAYELFLETVSRPDTPSAKENSSYRGSACYWLGHMTEHGEGVERDLRSARKWYAKGAACGQPECVEAVARLRIRPRRRH